MHKPLISNQAAKTLLQDNASNVQLVGVVSEYYNDAVLQKYRTVEKCGFTLIKTEDLEIDQVWKLKPAGKLQQHLQSKGLSPNKSSHILLFDTITFACGKKMTRFDASARLYAVLKYFGFEQVSIVFDEAVDASLPSFISDAQADPAPNLRLNLPNTPSPLWSIKNPDTFIDFTGLNQLIAGQQPYYLLDARSADEFAGTETGYDYVHLAGRIPTSINVINGEYQLSAKESLHAILERLKADLTKLNITPTDKVIWYCGTAWRASRMFALTQALGYRNVSIYDGGWNEWQQLHPEDATRHNNAQISSVDGMQAAHHPQL